MVNPVVMAKTRTLEAGNPEICQVNVLRRLGLASAPQIGFTLLELLVVLAIIAMASASVGFAMRDSTQSQLEREAIRLSALLESARARSQLSGVQVRWHVTAQGFRFEGLPAPIGQEPQVPDTWLDGDTRATVDEAGGLLQVNLLAEIVLGPDPIIAKQSITLTLRGQPDKNLRLVTDGVRPFVVQVQP
jgi:general secretion pathway protein H